MQHSSVELINYFLIKHLNCGFNYLLSISKICVIPYIKKVELDKKINLSSSTFLITDLYNFHSHNQLILPVKDSIASRQMSDRLQTQLATHIQGACQL